MSLALDMAMKIGSVRSVKTRMAQDRMVALDKRIQKKRASLEAFERGLLLRHLLLQCMARAREVGLKGKTVPLGACKIAQGRSKSARMISVCALGLGESKIELGESKIASTVIKLGGSKIARAVLKLGGSG